MADPEVSVGQAVTDSSGTTETAPDANAVGSGSPSSTTVSGPSEAHESFFDVKSIEGRPELQAAYKQMQSAFTKKMQGFRGQEQKIQAYERFSADPVDTMTQIAQQMGYRLVQAGGKEEAQDWNPQTWNDVLDRAKKEVMKDLTPVYRELRDLKKQSVESYLDSKYADWRTYRTTC